MTEFSQLFIDGVQGGLYIGMIAGFVGFSFCAMSNLFRQIAG